MRQFLHVLALAAITTFLGLSSTQAQICPQSVVPGANLVTNGDFEAGNTGFTSDYTFTAPTPPIPQERYGIGTNPNDYNNGFMANIGDHTSGAGNMFVADGSDDTSLDVYETSVNVTAGQTYAFSVWVANVHTSFDNPSSLTFFIDGAPIGTLTADASSNDWFQFFVGWTAPATGPVIISLRNSTTGLFGNDFALDDISFSTDCSILTGLSIPSTLPDSIYICSGSSVTLDSELDPTDYDFQWRDGGGSAIGGATGPSYTTSTEDRYFLCIDPFGLGCDVADTVDVLDGDFTVNDGSFCPTGAPTTPTLTASKPGQPGYCPFNWYTESSGGSPVGSGCSFNPTITCAESYFVEDTVANVPTPESNLGYPSTGHGFTSQQDGGSVTGNDKKLVFDASYAFDLESLYMFYNVGGGPGTATVEFVVRDGVGGTILSTSDPVALPITAGVGTPTEVQVGGMYVPAGTGLVLEINILSGSIFNFRHWTSGHTAFTDGPITFVGSASDNSLFPGMHAFSITGYVPCPRQQADAILTCVPVEICGNGIDDDCDGLIDCYDGDCCGTVACEDFYYCTVPGCEQDPGGLGDVQLHWETSTTDFDTRSSPVVADVDGDCEPEIVVSRNGNSQIRIVNGLTGVTETTITTPALAATCTGPAVADVDGDGTAEIFIVTNNRQLCRYEHTGGAATFCTASNQVGYTANAVAYAPNFADFNADGTPEVYMGNQVFNSATGAKIGEGGSGNSRGRISNSDDKGRLAVAADILPDDYCADCEGLELVCGNQVFAVDVTGTSVSLESSAPGSTTDYPDGFTVVADLDGDGDLDAIVVTRQDGGGSNSRCYAWDPNAGSITAAAYNSGDQHPGQPAVGDIDGDGDLEVVYLRGNGELLALEYGAGAFTQKYSVNINEQGFANKTTPTLFDFDGDGDLEIVVQTRGSGLEIRGGADGLIDTEIPTCSYGNNNSYAFRRPAIADVNGDGEAEIIAVCGTDANNPVGRLSVLHSDTTDLANTWMSTRELHNTHSYTPWMINDDLTVPSVPQDVNLAGIDGDLNVYNAQYPLRSTSGGLLGTQLPDLEATIDSVVYNTSDCVANPATVYYSICNSANTIIPRGFYVRIYEVSGALLTGFPQFVDPTGAQIGCDSCAQYTASIPSTAAPYDLYVSVNDNGTFASAVRTMPECAYPNNRPSEEIECPSPVTLVEFSGERVNLVHRLTWVTALEENNAYFIVERSADGENFEAIGSVPGQGTTSVTTSYTLTDHQPLEGVNYYRLRQVDNDGTGSYSSVITLRADAVGISPAYPNPTSNTVSLTVNTQSTSDQVSVQLINLLGQVVRTYQENFSLSTSLTVPTSDLAPGQYLMRTTTSSGQIRVQKLWIER